jgi:hypothetical protein
MTRASVAAIRLTESEVRLIRDPLEKAGIQMHSQDRQRVGGGNARPDSKSSVPHFRYGRAARKNLR